MGQSPRQFILGGSSESGSCTSRSVRVIADTRARRMTLTVALNSKMDSFIRSKYESRRWAMDGPPPSDPSTLEGGATEVEAAAPSVIPAPSTSSGQRPTHAASSSTASTRSQTISRQPQPHQLLSTGIAGRATHAISTAQQAQAAAATPAAASTPAPAPAAPPVTNDLFSLDFHSPTPPATQPAPKKDVKQDILSLFSTQTQQAAPAAAFGQFGGAVAAPPPEQNVWGQFNPASAAPPQATSMMGGAGTGMWGASSGWNAPTVPAQPNVWGGGASQPVQQPQLNLFNTTDVWASAGSTTNGAATAGGDLFGSSLPAKKEDAFGDLWGGFK